MPAPKKRECCGWRSLGKTHLSDLRCSREIDGYIHLDELDTCMRRTAVEDWVGRRAGGQVCRVWAQSSGNYPSVTLSTFQGCTVECIFSKRPARDFVF